MNVGGYGECRKWGAPMSGCSWVELVDYLLNSGNITWCGHVMCKLLEWYVESVEIACRACYLVRTRLIAHQVFVEMPKRGLIV
jgi:hypothetical protein